MSDMNSRELYYHQIHRLIRQDIRNDIKMGIDRSEIDYLNKCHDYLFDLCNNLVPKFAFFGGKGKGDDYSYSLWVDMKSDFAELITSTIQSVKAQQMVKNINSASAEALVRQVMKEAGLKYQYIGQQYRAKIAVKITPTSKLIFHINYKKINEFLPEAVASAKQLKELMSKLGKGTAIYKAYSWESWN